MCIYLSYCVARKLYYTFAYRYRIVSYKAISSIAKYITEQDSGQLWSFMRELYTVVTQAYLDQACMSVSQTFNLVLRMYKLKNSITHIDRTVSVEYLPDSRGTNINFASYIWGLYKSSFCIIRAYYLWSAIGTNTKHFIKCRKKTN